MDFETPSIECDTAYANLKLQSSRSTWIPPKVKRPSTVSNTLLPALSTVARECKPFALSWKLTPFFAGNLGLSRADRQWVSKQHTSHSCIGHLNRRFGESAPSIAGSLFLYGPRKDQLPGFVPKTRSAAYDLRGRGRGPAFPFPILNGRVSIPQHTLTITSRDLHTFEVRFCRLISIRHSAPERSQPHARPGRLPGGLTRHRDRVHQQNIEETCAVVDMALSRLTASSGSGVRHYFAPLLPPIFSPRSPPFLQPLIPRSHCPILTPPRLVYPDFWTRLERESMAPQNEGSTCRHVK